MNASSSLSCLLADEQFLTREGTAAVLARHPQVHLLGTCAHLKEALTLLPTQRPNVLLCCADCDDLYLLRQTLQAAADSDTQVLLLVAHYSPQRVQQWLALGVRGIITKECSEEEMWLAVRSVAEEKRFFCPRILDFVVQNDPTASSAPPLLTPREQEVLQWVAKGKTTQAIAEALHISVHTVNAHRKSILKKCKLRSGAELIAYAVQYFQP